MNANQPTDADLAALAQMRVEVSGMREALDSLHGDVERVAVGVQRLAEHVGPEAQRTALDALTATSPHHEREDAR